MMHMRVFVQNFGCSSNLSDGEVLAGCLKKAGFLLADSKENADVLIFNSCAVKGPTENRIINLLKHAPPKTKVIVSGCLPLISFERLVREVRFDAVVGPALGDKIVNVVRRVLKGEKIVDLEGALESKPSLDLPTVKSNSKISVIPINYGCLGSCAYCCVRHARGKLRSYQISEVTKRLQEDLALGVKEFWVTSQDTACYGVDKGTNLAALLLALTSIEGEFRVRVGMMTPNMVNPILDDLIEAFSSEKVYKFVHLPVQSGDNEVLKRMQRDYTVGEFKRIVASFRASFPRITLSTDVICGFPGETVEAHQNTLELIREVTPDIVNVSKFFARPKTAAWEMRDIFVAPNEIKKRSTQAAQLAKEYGLERNLRWIGWKGDILVDEKGKVAGSWIGRNFAYKPVVVRSLDDLRGRSLCVGVVRAFSTHLSAAIESG
jgi:threonylcarbamoyladenosine tRNA methylthiotransferase CDKAL1